MKCLLIDNFKIHGVFLDILAFFNKFIITQNLTLNINSK